MMWKKPKKRETMAKKYSLTFYPVSAIYPTNPVLIARQIGISMEDAQQLISDDEITDFITELKQRAMQIADERRTVASAFATASPVQSIINAQTGPTRRLGCRACGDALPTGARFCIECGTEVLS